MMKRIAVVMSAVLICMLIVSCESQNVKDAKEAFEKGKYDKVVECLEKEEKLNDELTKDLYVAKAHVAYDNGKYVEAIDNAIKVEDGKDLEVYKMAEEKIVKTSIKKGKAKTLLQAIKVDPDIATYAAGEITKACDELDYNAFKVLENLAKKLPDGDVKKQLAEYGEDNKIHKAEAFMIGDWEWLYEGEDKEHTTVKVVPYNNNLIGRVTKVTDHLVEYHYKKDDIYWSDFEFESSKRFLCYNIIRYKDEDVGGETVSGTINYKDGSISLNVTSASHPIRKWRKIA